MKDITNTNIFISNQLYVIQKELWNIAGEIQDEIKFFIIDEQIYVVFNGKKIRTGINLKKFVRNYVKNIDIYKYFIKDYYKNKDYLGELQDMLGWTCHRLRVGQTGTRAFKKFLDENLSKFRDSKSAKKFVTKNITKILKEEMKLSLQTRLNRDMRKISLDE